MWQQLRKDLQAGSTKALARSISLIENEAEGYEQFLQTLPYNDSAKIIGITGPPGAGKSTLVDALIGTLINDNKKVAVICVDPSSPFNLGAVLGDRIRMSNWYTNENVFIRSLATRGSMGGLHPKIIEITDLVKAAHYDYILVETVGVGQSEIEIAGLADTTIVVLVPEAGDEVQTMKAGLMEIADIFVVNKSDRPDADTFVKNLQLMLAPAFAQRRFEVAVIKIVASAGSGVDQLYTALKIHQASIPVNEKRSWLLADRAYHLIQQKRMRGITKELLEKKVRASLLKNDFNFYQFVKNTDTDPTV